VHVSELGQDYFHYDQSKHWMLGERTGKRYRLGDRVRIKVMRADIETSKIDFALVETIESADDVADEFSAAKKKPARAKAGNKKK
jgi:ribonuclease R